MSFTTNPFPDLADGSVENGFGNYATPVNYVSYDPTAQIEAAKQRANHTGTQLASTISDFSAAVAVASPFGSSSSYIVVKVGSDSTINGQNLLTAYAAAKAFTPNGSALNAGNRAVVFLPPASYDVASGGGLLLDTQYVDIVGLSQDPRHVYINLVNQTANDVQVSNITVAQNNCSMASNLSLTVWTNCRASSRTYAGGILPPAGGFGGSAAVLSGTFINCIGTTGNSNLGGFGAASCSLSGTFIGCTGNVTNGIFSGGFGGQNSTLSGVFTNCKGITYCSGGGGFGGGGSLLSGTFNNCVGQDDANSFGSAGFLGNSGTISGVLINCSSPTDVGIPYNRAYWGAKVRNYVDKNADIYHYN